MIKFSMPLWPALTPDELMSTVIPLLEESKEYVHDLYVTVRIPPFTSDAMGGVFVDGEEEIVLRNSLYVSDVTGIPLSATFNDITVTPSYENYLLFVKSFRRLYDKGIRIITLPNTTWLQFGLKKEFPDLYVKNTILNNVKSASEAAVLYEAGFDYLIYGRNFLRDRELLSEAKLAKDKMEQKLHRRLQCALLYNEMCAPHCPIQQDHYLYNLHRTTSSVAFFHSKQMRDIAPCVGKEANVDYILRSAGMPSYYSYLTEMAKYVDVFKLHGRESKQVFYDSLSILSQYARREFIDDPFRKILSKVDEKLRHAYLDKIQTCRFDCWKCDLCSSVAANYAKHTGRDSI